MTLDVTARRSSPATLVLLGLGWTLSMLGLAVAWWGWKVGEALQGRLVQAFTWAPIGHPTRLPMVSGDHPVLATLGLLVSVAILALTLWFAERQAQRGHLV